MAAIPPYHEDGDKWIQSGEQGRPHTYTLINSMCEGDTVP